MDSTYADVLPYDLCSTLVGIPGLIPGNVHCPLADNEPINYIMHPRSRLEFHENQRKFSPCSIRNIQHHLA